MAKKRKVSRRRFVGATTATLAAGLAASCKTPGLSGLQGAAGADFLSQVATARIHPGIGVARVGNSADEFFIGPEVTTPEPTAQGASRDRTGALKRQAARFRIYGYDREGRVLGEITAAMAAVSWRVHLANKKAQWYRFVAALDMPEAEAMRCPRRNARISGADRGGLAIDPGPRTIAGVSQAGADARFDGARFLGEPVSLGELRTDEEGRLLVLGGRGAAGSPFESALFNPSDADSFNNADGWYDDIADGPVSATLRIAGRSIPVDPAWVFVGPPNYAPDVIGWRTLHDLLSDTYIEAGMMPFPERTSFTRHVLPVLQRLSNLQWVNQGFAAGYGHRSEFAFDDPAVLSALAARPASRTADPAGEQRQRIYQAFRQQDTEAAQRRTWPWLYGDAFGSFPGSDKLNLALSPTRARHLRRWAEGNFEADFDPQATPPRRLSEVPLAAQPEMLDRAALHFCLADAFHPGCEVTWPMRHASLYRAPFRIRQRQEGDADPDYGDQLTQAICLSADGPLHAQGPGDLTKWMAIPWHGDTAFCRSGYEPNIDPFILTFWPARVPNHVLTETEYRIVMDTTQPRATRLEAFRIRRSWVRSLNGSAPAQMQQMVDGFDRLGVIEARPGVPNDPELPAVMLVESLPGGMGLSSDGEGPWRPRNKFEAAGWESEAQLLEFRRILGLDR